MLAHLHDWKLVAALVAAFVLIVPAASSAVIDAKPKEKKVARVIGYGQIRFNGAGPEKWAAIARRWKRAYERTERRLARATRYSPTVTEAMNLACATYGFCSTLWRKARCESGFSPTARNRSSDASGLFQFLPSTWASTPYAEASIFSPYANALAAGWMHRQGRGGEWVCR